ncbi:MAG: YggT family protein [Gemmatimonadetes bacterium]|nr:YggT family protein [Gemmatimonadota bacterium]
MRLVLGVMDVVLAALRPALLGAAALAAAICVVDWLVRTRRIGAFTPVARFFRSTVEPLMLPIERRIVRSGGLPTQAPWWTLAGIVVGGIVLISVLQFVQDQLRYLALASAGGAGSLFRLGLMWGFGLLKLAILVRVISSWINVSPYSPWIRWSYLLTEWMLRPLRAVIPAMGPFDVTPIAAYFLLAIAEQVVLR